MRRSLSSTRAEEPSANLAGSVIGPRAGGCQDPGRVFPGKKMAGRMGGRNRTAQNLIVHAVDEERSLVFVRGAVPGAKGKWVRVTDAVKKPQPIDSKVEE